MFDSGFLESAGSAAEIDPRDEIALSFSAAVVVTKEGGCYWQAGKAAAVVMEWLSDVRSATLRRKFTKNSPGYKETESDS